MCNDRPFLVLKQILLKELKIKDTSVKVTTKTEISTNCRWYCDDGY